MYLEVPMSTVKWIALLYLYDRKVSANVNQNLLKYIGDKSMSKSENINKIIPGG